MLYVGTCRDLRTRVRSYFTASETRSRMGEMVNLAATVTGIECATPLEARVRELRLIAAHKPRYNRRSRFPEKVHWLKLTVEPWPRLSLVRKVADDGADYLGPVRLAAHGREVPGRAARDVPDPPVQRPAADHAARSRRACSPRWAAACRRATAASTVDDYAALVAEVRDTLLRQADERGRGAHRADGPALRRRALRGGRRPPRPALRLPPGRVPHPAARRALLAAPSWSPPAARTTAAGRCTSSATAGWPRPA